MEESGNIQDLLRELQDLQNELHSLELLTQEESKGEQNKEEEKEELLEKEKEAEEEEEQLAIPEKKESKVLVSVEEVNNMILENKVLELELNHVRQLNANNQLEAQILEQQMQNLSQNRKITDALNSIYGETIDKCKDLFLMLYHVVPAINEQPDIFQGLTTLFDISEEELKYMSSKETQKREREQQLKQLEDQVESSSQSQEQSQNKTENNSEEQKGQEENKEPQAQENQQEKQ